MFGFFTGLAKGGTEVVKEASEREYTKQQQQRTLDFEKKLLDAKTANKKTEKWMDILEEGLKKRNKPMIQMAFKGLTGSETPDGIDMTMMSDGGGMMTYKNKDVTADNIATVKSQLRSRGFSNEVIDTIVPGSRITEDLESGTLVESTAETDAIKYSDGTNLIERKTSKSGAIISEKVLGPDPQSPEMTKKREQSQQAAITEGNLEREERKLVLNKVADFPKVLQSDKGLTQANNQIFKIKNVKELAKVGDYNQIAKAGLEVLVPRAFGEVGNLAQQEQNKWFTNLSIIRSLEQKWKSLVEGGLTEENLTDLNQLLDKYEKSLLEMSELQARSLAKTTEESVKLFEGYEKYKDSFQDQASAFMSRFGTDLTEEAVRSANSGTTVEKKATMKYVPGKGMVPVE